MLRVFDPAADPVFIPVIDALPQGSVWVDMINPTPAEEASVELMLGINVPTREDMDEIETSSRLYQDGGAIFMTANVATGILRENPETHAVSFILTPTHLVTLRYAEITAFERFSSHCERTPAVCETAPAALANLLDVIVDRLADSIEHVGAEIEAISRQAFRRARSDRQDRSRMTTPALQALLVRIGSAQDALSKARDSVLSLSRVMGYLAFAAPKGANLGPQLKSLSRDLSSLSDHAGYLGSNITFLLDASLGLISIEQNAVLKIFSVSAIVFMPPTLVAGIYGMNFDAMPELRWALGYPFAIVVMLLSAILPFAFFRWRGWL